jgi:hypothetical protein
VFSSRKLARKLHEDIAFRVLAAGNTPAHRTISDFRALHLGELAQLPEVDIPAEIARREARLSAIAKAKARLEEHQQQIDLARGRSPGDDRRPRDQDGKPGRQPEESGSLLRARVWRSQGYGTGQLHRSGQPLDETQRRRFLTTATTRRWPSMGKRRSLSRPN